MQNINEARTKEIVETPEIYIENRIAELDVHFNNKINKQPENSNSTTLKLAYLSTKYYLLNNIKMEMADFYIPCHSSRRWVEGSILVKFELFKSHIESPYLYKQSGLETSYYQVHKTLEDIQRDIKNPDITPKKKEVLNEYKLTLEELKKELDTQKEQKSEAQQDLQSQYNFNFNIDNDNDNDTKSQAQAQQNQQLNDDYIDQAQQNQQLNDDYIDQAQQDLESQYQQYQEFPAYNSNLVDEVQL